MRRLLTGLAVLAFGVVTVHAVDDPESVPGKVTVVKPARLAKFIAKPASPTVLDLPDTGNAPTTQGGTLRILDLGNGAAFMDVNLPSQGWKGLGGDGSKGYKYKGAGTATDPCKAVLVKTKIIKAVCKGPAVDFDQPFNGRLGAVLTLGPASKVYCSALGGTEVKNTADLLKRKNQLAADALCSCPASTFTFQNTPGVGTSGTIETNTGGSSGLTNGGLYFGSGSATVSLPGIVPDSEKSLVMNVECCTGDSLFLGPSTDAETGGSGERCTVAGCKFGAPLPLPNNLSTATSTCVFNTYLQDVVGEATCDGGDVRLDMPLNSAVFLTGDLLVNRCSGGTNPGGRCTVVNQLVDCPSGGTCVADPDLQPCPICNTTTGICNGGLNNGMACVPDGGVNIALTQFPTSHDCPVSTIVKVGDLPIPFLLSSGTQSDTAVPNGTQQRVFCGFCRDANATLGFGICAPGSTANVGGACSVAVDCCADPMACAVNNCGSAKPCSASTECTGDTREACEQRSEGAFGPGGGANMTITEIGIPAGPLGDFASHAGRLVSVFCIPPTFNGIIDNSADLPGPGAVSLPGTFNIDSPSGAFLDGGAPF